MAQNFYSQGAPTETGLVRTYVANTQTNTETLRSNFSGSSFPENAVAGQHCYRTDEEKEYRYTGTTWVEATEGSALAADIANASGAMRSLTDRLNVALNADGTLKNPIAAEIDEWKDTAIIATFVSANQFSVNGDMTPIYTKGRMLKIYNQDGNGVISVAGITTVVSSTYNDGITIITVSNNIFTSDLYDIKYGLIQETVAAPFNSVQREKRYEKGDIAFSSKLKSYMRLDCIQPGITATIEPEFSRVVTPASIAAPVNVTNITTNGGTTGTVTANGVFTGTSNEDIYIKLSAGTSGQAEAYNSITVSYRIGDEGEYTTVGLSDSTAQDIVDGVTIALSSDGVYEDGEIFRITCTAAIEATVDIGDTINDGTVIWQVADSRGTDFSNARKPSTTYVEKDIRYDSDLPVGWYLECTTGGTTSASDLVITSPTVGGTVTDGTVVWTIRVVASTADIPAPVDISGKANVDLDNLSLAGEQKIQSVSPRYLTDSYYNTSNWYRVYSDGWVEQGGEITDATTTGTSKTITLLKPFSDTKYTVLALQGPASAGYTINISEKTTTTIKLNTVIKANYGSADPQWYACGLGAQS